MEAIKLQRRYPQFTQEQVIALCAQFRAIDLDSTGQLPKSTLFTALSSPAASSTPAGQYSYDQIRETLKTVQIDSTGTVALEDFVQLVSKLKDGEGEGAGKVLRGGALKGLVAGAAAGATLSAAPTTGTGGGKVLVGGSNSNVSHTINEDERTEFTRHINQVRSLSALFEPRL